MTVVWWIIGILAVLFLVYLWLILFSVAFWFMGYNAVTSAFTRYMQVQWGYDIKAASLCLMVATVGAVLSYLPVGILSSRFGRKKMIQAGVIPVTWQQVMLEWQRDWARKETYTAVMDIVREHSGAYGMGVDYAYTMVHKAPSRQKSEHRTLAPVPAR